MNSEEREAWFSEVLETILDDTGGFNEWVTLLAIEAKKSFVAGADISTIVLCAACCEALLKTEDTGRLSSGLSELIKSSKLDSDLMKRIDDVRHDRNYWMHSKFLKTDAEPFDYRNIYTAELEAKAKRAILAMLEAIHPLELQ